MVADMIHFNLEQQPHPFVEKWQQLLDKVQQSVAAYEPAYSQMAAVKYFEAKTIHSSLFTLH
jgi:2-succinyl-5-enolpyruvyl-6-hydroxy-3-cyclohexene-1-carboxylate synthase